MNCPSCNSPVSEGAFICANCDHILDTSFLGSDITNESTPAPRLEADAAAPRDTPASAAAVAPLPSPRFAQQGGAQTGARVSKRLDEIAAPSEDTKEAVDEMLADFKNMAVSQKLTVTGAAVVVASLALPWKNTIDGNDMIGLLGGGWFAGLLAGLVLVTMFARRHPQLQKWRPQLMQGIAGTSLVAIVSCVYFVSSSFEYQTIGSVGRLVHKTTAWPDFGVYVALAASVIMLGGSVKSYLDRDTLPD